MSWPFQPLLPAAAAADGAAPASTDAQLDTPFKTRRIDSRIRQRDAWGAALAPAAATPPAFPVAAIFGAQPVRRRRETAERRLVEVADLHWQYIAPTVAAILPAPKAKVVAFRRTRAQVLESPVYPATPATGPPLPAWQLAAARRVSRDKRIQRLPDQPAYPVASAPTVAVPAFEVVRPKRRRNGSSAGFVAVDSFIGEPAATPPSSSQDATLERPFSTRRIASRRFKRETPQPYYPAGSGPAPVEFAAILLRPTVRRESRRTLLRGTVHPFYPATDTTQVQLAALVPARALRRTSQRKFLRGEVVPEYPSTPAPTTPAVFPSFLQGGKHYRRNSERRLLEAIYPQEYPQTPVAPPGEGDYIIRARRRGRR